MKVKIHGWVGRDGTLSFGYWSDKDGEDATDIAVLSDALDHLPWRDVQYVCVEAEIDMDDLFKDRTVSGTVSAARTPQTEDES